MNPPKFVSSISIESVESSVQNLTKSWNRRQKWKKFCLNPSTDEEEEEEEEAEEGPSNNIMAAWRSKLTRFLESTPVHTVSILLLFMDLILTILELSSSLLSCTPKKNYYKVEKVWYHWVGIGILILLSAKAVALAIGLGRSFFKRPGYVVDGAVASMALFLEAFLEKEGGGLLVVVSLWRVVRVVESAFELSDEAIEAQIEGIICQFELLREENARLLETIAEKDMVIHKLQEIIEKLEEQSKCNAPIA
ncbi:uncharacterized protein LOC8288007 [Ricinus communis]|uniref:Voltage-gated hydrogen channel 1 n=1 Tax=Ricinus communis TaxID=3988 RepID=B9T8U4_RICCO|nr:uncharacterized protein LOC8288007 [Ricinus communis]EEF27720.1 conserved hypothetical protein [Ricinus communis]|eukprot:XP_002534663.1 uncharacterized protein LOC8288007 [Ricinus communis]